MELKDTSERMVAEFYQADPQRYLIYLYHLATYKFASRSVIGKKVLDFGCGSGYGTAFIADECSSIIGIDIARDAIEYASTHYSKPNLSFLVVDRIEAASLPFDDQSFETVLSFQVIEHINGVNKYLSEINRVLVPGGVLILATPDRSQRLLPLQKPWNFWHVQEYSARSLDKLIRRYFKNVDVLKMGGTREIIDIEIKRVNKNKWLTLPLTLPFVPDTIRRKGLRLIKILIGENEERDMEKSWISWMNISDFSISPSENPSINLVVVATKTMRP